MTKIQKYPMECKTCKVEYFIEFLKGQALKTTDADNAVCPDGHKGSYYLPW